MKTAFALLFALSLTGAHAALADDTTAAPNTTTVKTSDVQKPDEKVKDIDDEITNAKLRAENGSKSKWSVKSDINYNGGNVERPFSDIRPNYSGIAGQDTKTNISGTIGIAYRASQHDTVRLGTGLAFRTPFQNSWQDASNSNGKRQTDVSNPYLDYSRAFRVSNVQNVFDTSYTQYTQDVYSNAYQMVGTYDVNHTFAWEFQGSGWSPGLNIDANYTFYKNSATPDDVSTNPDSGFTDYTLAAFPYVEYAFNDSYSFRTVFRFLTYDHYRSDAASTFYRELYTQSVGLGVAMTRDIYLYPNLQFAPEHMAPDRTNVGLTATVSLF